LARDGKTVLLGLLRNREISAREAAKRAGYGGRSHRPPKPSEPEPPKSIDDFVKALIA